MAESLTVYEVRDPEVAFPMERDAFYDEQLRTINKGGKATKMTEVVAVLLFNREGEIILQKRSHTKHHNPFLIDKAIGGHITFGNSPMYTAMVETVQELRVPSIVLRNDEDFEKTFRLLEGYLDNVALIKELDRAIIELERNIHGKTYVLPNKVHLYIGIYGGATKPVDKEATGVLYYSLDILKKEMDAQPQNFSYDLHYYLKEYKHEIEDFLKHFE